MTVQKISASVGKNGVNKSNDVVIVQNLLNKFITANQLDYMVLETDGQVGNFTRTAIGLFQAFFLGHNNPDKRVDPNGPTLDALNGPVNQPQKGNPHDSIQKSIVAVLRGSAIEKIRFTLGSDTITPTDFRNIGNRFESRHLKAYYDPGEEGNAEYFHANQDDKTWGYMQVGFQSAGTPTQKSIVVHEATHAICDSRSTMMMIDRAEAIGHLAQAIYYRALTGSHLRVANTATTDVLSHCGNIAIRMELDRTTTVSAPDRERLMELVRRLPTYKENTGFFYDGV